MRWKARNSDAVTIPSLTAIFAESAIRARVNAASLPPGSQLSGSRMLASEPTTPVRSLADSLGYESCREKVGIVVSAPQPYILAVEAVDGTADLVIKPMTAIAVEGITGTARSAEGELLLVVGLSFLMDGCRSNVRMAA